MAKFLSSPIQLALEHERRILWAMMIFPFFAVGLTVTFKFVPRLYRFLVREDSLVEWATAGIYLAAAIFAASLVVHFWRKKNRIYGLLYGVLAIGMTFVALEEISWGQRQLGLETPAIIAENNVQKELTFHNMSQFPLHEAYIAVGLYGAFSRLIASALLRIRDAKFIDLLTPPYVLAFYFLIPSLYYIYTEYLYYTQLVPHELRWSEYWTDEHFINGRDQEPVELLLSFGFLLFTVINWVRYRVGAALTLGSSAGVGSQASNDPD